MLELQGEAAAETFLAAITAAKAGVVHGAAVETKTVEEYGELRLFVTPDKKAGFALKGVFGIEV